MESWTSSLILTCLISPFVGMLLGLLFGRSKRKSPQVYGQMAAIWTLLGWLVIGVMGYFESGSLNVALPANRFWSGLGPLSITWLVAISFFWTVGFSRSRTISPGTLTVQLLGFGITQVAVVTSHCGLQWGLVATTSWLTISQVSSDSDNRTPSVRWGLIVSDFVWLGAILNIATVLGSMEIDTLCGAATLQALAPPQSTFVVTGVYGLMIALALRCSLFPMSSLVRGEVSAMANFSCLGMGSFLLLQYQPLLTAFAETRSLMIGLGVLSVVLLPVIGLSETNRNLKMFRVTSATVAMMWVGMGSAPQRVDTLVKLAACTFIVSGLGMIQLSKSVRRLLLTLFACGICGQEWCFGAVRYASAHVEDVHVPEAFMVIVLLGHALNCYLLSAYSEDEQETTANEPLRLLPAIGIVLILVAQGLPTWGWHRSWNLQIGTLAVIALLAATVFGGYHSVLTGILNRRGKSLVRLSQTQFYGEAFFWIFSIPIQIVSLSILAMTLSKDFLFAQMRAMTQSTATLTTLMDEESPHSMGIISITIMTLVIGWAVSIWL